MEELTIVVNRTLLHAALMENRARFVKSYEALLKAYEKKVIEYQKKYHAYTRKVIAKQLKRQDEGQPMAPPKPEDRTKSYDFYLEMLEKHDNQTIELTESLFRQLWKDEWTWTRNHYDIMNFYASGSADVAEMLNYYSTGE